MGLTFCRHVYCDGLYIKNSLGWGFISKEPMCTYDVNYHNNKVYNNDPSTYVELSNLLNTYTKQARINNKYRIR